MESNFWAGVLRVSEGFRARFGRTDRPVLLPASGVLRTAIVGLPRKPGSAPRCSEDVAQAFDRREGTLQMIDVHNFDRE